jgi:hypothetical protein
LRGAWGECEVVRGGTDRSFRSTAVLSRKVKAGSSRIAFQLPTPH